MGTIALRSAVSRKINQMEIPNVKQLDIIAFGNCLEDSFYYFPNMTNEERTFITHGTTFEEIKEYGKNRKRYLIDKEDVDYRVDVETLQNLRSQIADPEYNEEDRKYLKQEMARLAAIPQDGGIPDPFFDHELSYDEAVQAFENQKEAELFEYGKTDKKLNAIIEANLKKDYN